MKTTRIIYVGLLCASLAGCGLVTVSLTPEQVAQVTAQVGDVSKASQAELIAAVNATLGVHAESVKVAAGKLEADLVPLGQEIAEQAGATFIEKVIQNPSVDGLIGALLGAAGVGLAVARRRGRLQGVTPTPQMPEPPKVATPATKPPSPFAVPPEGSA